jgi:hypothetical protein
MRASPAGLRTAAPAPRAFAWLVDCPLSLSWTAAIERWLCRLEVRTCRSREGNYLIPLPRSILSGAPVNQRLRVRNPPVVVAVRSSGISGSASVQ